MIDNMFIKNDIIGSAMQATIVRNDVINNNIANSDVPGFKKKAVRFETYLNKTLNSTPLQSLTENDVKNIRPTIHIEHKNYNYRLDENNVDIESEMTDLYQNSIRYDTLASCVMNNYKRLNLVLSGSK